MLDAEIVRVPHEGGVRDERDRGRELEQDREEVPELGEEPEHRRAPAQLGEPVGPWAPVREPRGRLLVAEAGRPALERARASCSGRRWSAASARPATRAASTSSAL